jgi:DNA repair protein RadC
MEGSLQAVFVDSRDRVALRVDLEEGTASVDEIFLRHLMMLIGDVDLPRVALVVSRSSGRPSRVDRLLWRELGIRLRGGTTRLLDMIVVGDESFWSASTGRSAPIDHGSVARPSDAAAAGS